MQQYNWPTYFLVQQTIGFWGEEGRICVIKPPTRASLSFLFMKLSVVCLPSYNVSDAIQWLLSLWCPSTVLTNVSEREFIEGRRRALGRFINLVARHPFFSEDELVKTFLTFSGSVRGAFVTRCCLALWLLHNKHYRHDD